MAAIGARGGVAPREPAAVRRARVRVEGIVQGVGFRPHVHRLATALGLTGLVLNDEHGVLLEVEGPPPDVERFLRRLAAEAPPLARVEAMAVEEIAPTGEAGFAIALSARSGTPAALVSPDTAVCEACLRELHDPADRRFRYPFVNCTHCGPRFTIVCDVPYDRPLTTMADFAMCPDCRAEYDDPLDRRFHAQPNACPACGPTARLVGAAAGDRPASGDAVAAAAAALVDGRIVAVKGVGGFHLACRADDDAAVTRLRSRKHREDRPFAVMVAGVPMAAGLAHLTSRDEALLTSRQRPIVLVARRAGAGVAPAVAPGSRELGLMLPYSPLHHLLCEDAAVPLVMTSGNLSDEPICFRDEEATSRLAGIADCFLLHDRPIRTRTDDSVVRTISVAEDRRPLMVRRSRGHVPESLDLPVTASEPLLGAGAELKHTFCLAKGRRAWVSHHIGDLTNYETLRSLQEGVAHFQRLFGVTPAVVAHDLHPDYLSTSYALEREGVRWIGVQHHHAHLAACLAEHGERGPAVGAIFDGTGLGADGTIWGGELLIGGLEGFRRAGHLWPVRMPGGDQAVRQPWRMACAWLAEATGTAPDVPAALAGRVAPDRWRSIASLAQSGIAAPATTSMGRLFDAVAALCGLRAEVGYEGQAAIELEAAADPGETRAYGVELVGGDDGSALVMDVRGTVLEVHRDVQAGVPVGAVAARFHAGVSAATAEACARLAERSGLDTVVLSGGVWQNRRLLEATASMLARRGLRVLVPERLPPNDGGISYGQIAVAAALGGRSGVAGALP